MLIAPYERLPWRSWSNFDKQRAVKRLLSRERPLQAGGIVRLACFALLGSAFLGGSVLAENRAASNLSLYADDDYTDVITSVTRVSGDPWEGGTLEASYLIDIISSASIDVISAATSRFDEKRQALGLAVRQDFDGTIANINYGYSHEPDYGGHGIGIGFVSELAQRNATLGASYALELSDIGRSGDPNFSQGLVTHGLDLIGSQILTPWLVSNFGYAMGLQLGYTAKPYRTAGAIQLVANDASGLTRVVSVPERHPDSRFKHALFGGLKAHLFAETAAELRYRLYLDSWGLQGHTVEALAHLGLTRNFGARLRYRFYTQNSSVIWQDLYDQPRQYMSRDRELSALTGNLVGVKVFARSEDLLGLASVQLTGKVDLFRYTYEEVALLPQRLGFVVESGVEVVF